MSYFFSPGFAETMGRDESAIIYNTFPAETHDLVDLLLYASDDRIQTVHSFIDTPSLAVQSLAMNIGRQLPTYGHADSPDFLTETGQTRAIEREDMFAIAEGPVAANQSGRFITVLERVSRAEPEPARHIKPGRLSALFARV